MKTIAQIVKMAKDEASPVVSELIDYIKQQGEMIQKLKDEIALISSTIAAILP